MLIRMTLEFCQTLEKYFKSRFTLEEKLREEWFIELYNIRLNDSQLNSHWALHWSNYAK